MVGAQTALGETSRNLPVCVNRAVMHWSYGQSKQNRHWRIGLDWLHTDLTEHQVVIFTQKVDFNP